MLGCFGFNRYRRRKGELAAFTVGYRVGVGDLRGVPDDIHFGASPPMKPAAPDSRAAHLLGRKGQVTESSSQTESLSIVQAHTKRTYPNR